MNTYAQYKVRLTDHAYRRYLERTGSMEREWLQNWIAEQIEKQNYRVNRTMIQADDIWWAFTIEGDTMVIKTCYGRSHLDLPQAIGWAIRHNDRIALDYGE